MNRFAATAVLAASATAFVACANGGAPDIRASSQENSMSLPPSASRPPAPEVSPVEHNGVRYEQDAHDDRQGDQPGGYLAAIDIGSGKRLWRIKVYEIADSRAAGVEPISRYFRSMRLVDDGHALEIENESGGRYRVDLATHTVAQIGGPPEQAPAVAPKPKPMPQ
jgi:hypothetical protein